jgi:diacylglycerol kinase family enzyme
MSGRAVSTVLGGRARWVRITSSQPLPVRADAVDLGTTPAVFEIRPTALAVIAPDRLAPR